MEGHAVAVVYQHLLPAAAVAAVPTVAAVAAVPQTRTVALGVTKHAAMPVADAAAVTVYSSRMAGLNRT